MENNHLPEPKPVYRKRHRSFFWPFLLISLGVLLLLSNLGIVGWSTWNLVGRFWPLILVAVGIDVLVGNRSTLGAILSALIILVLIGAVAGAVVFADQLPMISRYTQDSPWQSAHVEQALEDYESASILIDWTSLQGQLGALENSRNLIEGDLSYQGELVFEVESHGSQADVRLDTRQVNNWVALPLQPTPRDPWEIYLSPEIPLDLTLDSGSGSCEFDLSGLMLEALYLDSGSGSINLGLPEGQSYPVKVYSGSGSVRITLPQETGIRVKLDSGSGSFNPGNRFSLVSGEKQGDGVWESSNYDSAKYTIEMEIDQGSGSIIFK